MLTNLKIPRTKREMGIYILTLQEDIVNLNQRFDQLETLIRERKFKRKDIILGSLLLPVSSGILLIILTKVFDMI